jgi:hypothetical protein
MVGWMYDLDDTLMKGKDNVVELAATHLHQSAIAENEIGKQPVSRRHRGGEGCGKRKAKKRKRNRILAGGVAQRKGYSCRPSRHSSE